MEEKQGLFTGFRLGLRHFIFLIIIMLTLRFVGVLFTLLLSIFLGVLGGIIAVLQERGKLPRWL